MINFHFYECTTLEHVAEWGRAKAGKVYPRGTSTIQISASRGQIGYLDYPQEVATKDVAIIPIAGIDPKYFNLILQKNIDLFMNKYATGINIQEKEIGKFPIELHEPETQKAYVKMMERIEDESKVIADEIAILQNLKAKLLNDMFV